MGGAVDFPRVRVALLKDTTTSAGVSSLAVTCSGAVKLTFGQLEPLRGVGRRRWRLEARSM